MGKEKKLWCVPSNMPSWVAVNLSTNIFPVRKMQLREEQFKSLISESVEDAGGGFTAHSVDSFVHR